MFFPRKRDASLLADKQISKIENERLSLHTQYRQYNEEQDMIQGYIARHASLRPKTNILTVLYIVLLYFALCGSVTLLITVCARNAAEKSCLLIPLIWIVPVLISIRFFLIKLVECYQHYAKESTRRKCLCKPTCSEYTIAVLKKYPLIIALRKIGKRLFGTCKGGVYKIDPP